MRALAAMGPAEPAQAHQGQSGLPDRLHPLHALRHPRAHVRQARGNW